ncbi:hypothetical protein [Aureispira anguillae]|uniref:Uncharacterized protein n=1 Tax=Aureispira anguillae TaxID=2864201 RepID=A0A915Y9S6_9BACT|nr:hypothetical protein [Aureispira anguillae]BDS09344.1 hypothetical protein AsAng_0000420 [Aureispira anguillae]
MKAPHPQFINALKILQKRLASFVLEFKKIDHPKQQKHYLAFAKASVATLKIIQPIIKATKEVVPNCPPEDIPACIHKYDDAKDPQILNSRINIIKKHKEDYENYLLNCFGIQLGWKDGLPSPNVGGKFSFRRKNNRLIIYTKKMEKILA